MTDHKTGRNRTSMATMVDGGRVLQPILYGMALETLTGERVEEGRLSFCTSAGGFTIHRITLDDVSRRRAIEVLEVIDRAIEAGTLAARPADGACSRCDFGCVCGTEEAAHAAQAGKPLCRSRRIEANPMSASDDRG